MPTARLTSFFPAIRAVAKRRRVALAVVALVSVVALVAPAAADGPARNRTISRYEIQFLKDMAAHHHHAVMMATDIMMEGNRMCLEREGEIRRELFDLCAAIVELQNEEIMMMMTWARQWYGVTLTMQDLMGHMTPEMTATLNEMSNATTAEFERLFLEEMIVHHAAALQPARQCKGKAEHAELKKLCRDILEVQVAEIELMRDLLCQWFRECNFRVDPHKRDAMHG